MPLGVFLVFFIYLFIYYYFILFIYLFIFFYAFQEKEASHFNVNCLLSRQKLYQASFLRKKMSSALLNNIFMG